MNDKTTVHDSIASTLKATQAPYKRPRDGFSHRL